MAIPPTDSVAANENAPGGANAPRRRVLAECVAGSARASACGRRGVAICDRCHGGPPFFDDEVVRMAPQRLTPERLLGLGERFASAEADIVEGVLVELAKLSPRMHSLLPQEKEREDTAE